MSAGTYCVYILASRRYGTLYIGVTNNLRIRIEQHRAGLGSKFVKQHKVYRLVHVEEFSSPQDAIAREAVEKLAPRLESSTDRKGEAGVE
jgi:putative endonuclease